MRPAALALAAGGLGVIALVAWYGAAAIGAEVLQAAWALPPILAIHAATQWLSAIAWRWATGGHHPHLGHWLTIRIIRESVNGLLPVAQLGGNLVAIRMLMHRGVSGTAATAGTTIDVTLEALTQLIFTLAGIATLATLHPNGAWAPWVQGGVAAMALGIAGFLVAQRMAGLRMIEWIAAKLVRVFPRLTLDTVRRLFAALADRQRQYAMLARATALHLLTLLLGVGETWLALTAMGRPTSLAEALVIESLGVAVRGAAFAVPGGLGVQEAGLVLVGGLFGVPPDQAIALSMTKRLRELTFGVPGLLAWQWLESRHHLRRRK